MWPKNYKDYPVDTPLVHYPVEPGKGIIGCEMHEINGWGEDWHRYDSIFYKTRKKSRFKGFLESLTFKKKRS